MDSDEQLAGIGCRLLQPKHTSSPTPVSIIGLARHQLKKHAGLLVRPFGIRLLSKQQTSNYLSTAGTELLHQPSIAVTLPPVQSIISPEKHLFEQKNITTAAARVWRYNSANASGRQLRSGGFLLNGQVLDTDFGNSAVIQELFVPRRRPVHIAKVLIAPWSHYWTGYFDYMFFVALKLCRIKSTLSAAEFSDAVVCYPLFNTAYEREILALLGVKPENVLDSRQVNVQCETCLLGSNDSWFYPNADDIQAFKQLVEAQIPVATLATERIYIRRAGRRRVIDEDAVLALVQRHGFRIIEDVPRTLTEQIQLYANAAIIMGPHGASFANIIWCRPGTHLIELFPNTYMPDYFRYLAQTLNLGYSAYCQGVPISSDHRYVNDDVAVDLAELDRLLTLTLLPLHC